MLLIRATRSLMLPTSRSSVTLFPVVPIMMSEALSRSAASTIACDGSPSRSRLCTLSPASSSMRQSRLRHVREDHLLGSGVSKLNDMLLSPQSTF